MKRSPEGVNTLTQDGITPEKKLYYQKSTPNSPISLLKKPLSKTASMHND